MIFIIKGKYYNKSKKFNYKKNIYIYKHLYY